VAALNDVVFEQFDADHSGAVHRDNFHDEMPQCGGTSPAIQVVVVAGGRKAVPGLPPPVLLRPSTGRRSLRSALGGDRRQGMAAWDVARQRSRREEAHARGPMRG
jgi:hypothetical protein